MQPIAEVPPCTHGAMNTGGAGTSLWPIPRFDLSEYAYSPFSAWETGFIQEE
jgi:hypothetical protein